MLIELRALVNSFPHTTILQQTTWNISYQNYEKCLYMKVYLLTKVEKIVAKVEIACFEQFLRLSQCFQRLSAAEATASVYMWKGL